MQARVLSAARGAGWLAQGWRLFRAAPLAWLALVLAYWMLMTFTAVLPLIGVVIASGLVPAFTVGFMAAARAAERGEPVRLAALFAGLREAPRAQAALGATYVGCLALVLGTSALMDGGALARWMLAGERPSEEVLQSGEFFGALALAALTYAPVMAMFWFAPPLAAWHATGAAKGLFFSFYACLVNWRAFAVYGLAAAAVSVALPLAVVAVLALFAPGAAARAAMGFAFPLLVMLLPTLFASFYVSYREVFAQPAAEAAV